MACLDHQMYSPSDHQMSPRISFSNDFAESAHLNHAARPPPPPPSVSSDFEFSVANASLQLPADQLFSKGRILPLKPSGRFQKPPPPSSTTTTTLRDELLSGDGEDDHGDALSPLGSHKPPLKGGRWKGFLGLRKHHFPAKKAPETPANSHAMFAFPLQDPTTFSRPPQGGRSRGEGDTETKL